VSRAPAMRPSLFRCGLAPRLVAAALYGLLAFGAVALLAPLRAPSAARPAATPSVAGPTPTLGTQATLCLESLQPVAAWEVRLDGATIPARRSDATTWIAEVAPAPGAALVIDAAPAGDGPAAHNALRIRIAGTPTSRDQTFWCERTWSVTTRVDQLIRAAAPIDPADLP